MDQNVVVLSFAEESRAFEALSLLKNAVGPQLKLHNAVVVQRDAQGMLNIRDQASDGAVARVALNGTLIGALVGMLAGPGPAMLSEMFPTRVRYTGLGLAYSLSNAIFSGCAGLIITGLIKETGNLDIPAYYVMATAVVSIVALMTLRKDDHLRTLEE